MQGHTDTLDAGCRTSGGNGGTPAARTFGLASAALISASILSKHSPFRAAVHFLGVHF